MQWIQILLWAVPQQTGGTEEVRAKYSGWGRCSLKFSGQIHLKNSGKEEVRLSRSVFGGGELERPSDFMVASSWADPFCVYPRRVSIWCFQTSTFSPVSINQLKAAGKYPICFVWEHWVKKILCLPSDLSQPEQQHRFIPALSSHWWVKNWCCPAVVLHSDASCAVNNLE